MDGDLRGFVRCFLPCTTDGYARMFLKVMYG